MQPIHVTELGESVATLINPLCGYALYYVNDYCGQIIPFGDVIENPEEIDWVCNLFAVPSTQSDARRWAYVLKHRQQCSWPPAIYDHALPGTVMKATD